MNNIKIKSHGSHWINNGKELLCPECRTCSITKHIVKLGLKYEMSCYCSNCGCTYIITRNDSE